MNVHTYRQHAARAASGFADVSVLEVTGDESIEGGGEWSFCAQITPHLSPSQEHLWSAWVTFLLSYKSPPAFFK